MTQGGLYLILSVILVFLLLWCLTWIHLDVEAEWKVAGLISRNILFHTDSAQERNKTTLQEWWIQNVHVIMHKPYGHFKVQERRKQSKNIQPSCRSWLTMLLYAVCCTRMLHGQAVWPSLCMMWEQARCCAGMMLDVQTACVVYRGVCERVAGWLQHAASIMHF